MNASLANIDEAARQQYEQAWRQGRPDSLEHYLPSAQHPLFQATLEELVLIEIEMSWKTWQSSQSSNKPDLIENYLKRFPSLQQQNVIQRLIEQECHSRRQSQDQPTEAEYCQRFPELTFKRIFFESPKPKSSSTALNWASGNQFGRYRLDKEYSRGSFGVVWQAEDTTLGRTVAIKQLKEYLADRPEYRQRFLAEAKITAQLQHPGIVPIHEMSGEDGLPYYSMNLVGGETLAEAIEAYHRQAGNTSQGALQWQKLITAFLAVVRTMAFAHNKGFLHRDLKPANIILGQYGETLILDWGLAKQINALELNTEITVPLDEVSSHATQQGAIVGTPAYMSPEQAAGRTEAISPRSDVFSLGIILYELLTGQRPFRGETQQVLTSIHKGDRFPLPSQLKRNTSKAIEAICLKALSHEPESRYADADLFRADLERFLADEPVVAFAEPWWYRTARWIRRHRILATGMAVTTFLIIIGSIVGYFLYSAAQATRMQEAHERLQRLEISTQADESAAETEVKTARYSSAVALLDRAVLATHQHSELAGVQERLAARSSRLKKVAEFLKLADQAEYLAAMDKDEASINKAERALNLLNTFQHLPEWWKHTPTDDLDSEQTLQLHEDASRLILLLCLERVKLGTITLLGGDKYFRSALELLPAIQNYHQWQWGGLSHSGLIIENFCYHRLGKKEKLKPLGASLPRGPSDHFFIGICHFWIASLPSNIKIETMLPASVSQDLIALGGIDLKTPFETSLSMLRMAVTLEPRRYWTYIWLGWCLHFRQDFEGAGQSFSSAIALRPYQAFAYIERGTVLLQQLYRCHNLLNTRPYLAALANRHQPVMGNLGPILSEAIASQFLPGLHAQAQSKTTERIVHGLEIGIKQEPDSAALHFQLSRCYLWQGLSEKSLQSFGTGLDYSAPIKLLSGESFIDGISLQQPIQDLAQHWQFANLMTHQNRLGILAQAYWLLRNNSAAEAAIGEALKTDPENSQARLVRGLLGLQQKHYDSAQADLTFVIQKEPSHFMARLGLARLAELREEWESALQQYQSLDPKATTDWQRAEVGLGEARILMKLQRQGLARQVIDRISDYAPLTVASITRNWFK